DRICRIGQTDGCLYRFLVADHPIDQLLFEKLSEKKALVEATLHQSSSQVANGALQLLRGVQAGEVAEVHTHNCPTCNKVLLPQISRSEKNPGKEYVRCQDCNFFAWTAEIEKLKLAPCPKCQRQVTVKVCKNGKKHDGRRFVDCPVCLFSWIDPQNPKAPKEKKLSRSEQIVFGKRNYGDQKGNQAVITNSVSPEERVELAVCLRSLLAVCDGAHVKDFSGFNAPDAPIARLYDQAIESGEDVNWRGLKDMLIKYRKTQL
ncbi:MAG: hypothetical protein Q8P59_03980, partial [Dehalococcoidia bacterium]|nr:hypothetical protein [Dehalococcoidia bacterium]